MQTLILDLENAWKRTMGCCQVAERREKVAVVRHSRSGLRTPRVERRGVDVEDLGPGSHLQVEFDFASSQQQQQPSSPASLAPTVTSSLLLPEVAAKTFSESNPFSTKYADQSLDLERNRPAIMKHLLKNREHYKMAEFRIRGDRQIAESVIARYPELYMHAPLHIREDVDIASRVPTPRYSVLY